MDGGKSDCFIVPLKSGKVNSSRPGGGKGATVRPTFERNHGRNNEFTNRVNVFLKRLQAIAKLASHQPKLTLTTLAHHIEEGWLREAFRRTRKIAAAGIDGTTAEDYARNLDENLNHLLQRLKAGQYRAPVVRRTYIEKDGGKKRPLGIPTVEDKVLQRAVAMILEAVYEQDFHDCSYGFRPKRSPHQALKSLRDQLHEIKGGYVIQLDIRSFFDEMDHNQLREMLSSRV